MEPEKTAKAAPGARGASLPQRTHRSDTVTSIIQVIGRGFGPAAARRALRAVAQVHRIEGLPPLVVSMDNRLPVAGRFVVDETFVPQQILLLPSSESIESNLAHEVGHFLDFAAFHPEVGYASEIPEQREDLLLKAFRRILVAAATSPTYARLFEMRDRKAVVIIGADSLGYTIPIDQRIVSYAIRPREVFARVYAQYITVRSDDSVLQGQLQDFLRPPRGDVYYPMQWPHDEFEPIALMLDALFKAKGWQ